MRRVATDEYEPVVSIVEVVRIGIVGIEPQTIVIVFDSEGVEVAIRIAKYTKCLLYHCPLNTLWAVFYLAYLMRQHFAPSIFIF